ncbi:MAG: hypothetical protein U9R51_00895, partial [Actinomycetota bacterium]|nr:hypothetical protein [Actinomycetota bacterium]
MAMRRVVCLVLLALLLAACGVGGAGSAPPSEIVEPSVDELIEQFGVTPAELQDIQFIADEEGWTLSEALDRIAWQQGFAAFVQELRETYPAEFAGGAILGDTGARTVRLGFRSTVPVEVRADPRLQHLDVEFDEMLGFSEDDLSRQVIEVQRAMLDAGFSDVASGPDIFSGVIDVAAVRREVDRGKADQEIVADLPPAARADNVHIVFVDELPRSDD